MCRCRNGLSNRKNFELEQHTIAQKTPKYCLKMERIFYPQPFLIFIR